MLDRNWCLHFFQNLRSIQAPFHPLYRHDHVEITVHILLSVTYLTDLLPDTLMCRNVLGAEKRRRVLAFVHVDG